MKVKLLIIVTAFTLALHPLVSISQQKLRVGFSIPINKITAEGMKEAKAAGVDCIETYLGPYVDTARQFKLTEQEIIDKVKAAKKAADEAGIEIWSVHMLYGKNIDISLPDEQTTPGGCSTSQENSWLL